MLNATRNLLSERLAKLGMIAGKLSPAEVGYVLNDVVQAQWLLGARSGPFLV